MKPVVLVVLDGWGYREDKAGNAVLAAQTPVFDRLWKSYPHTLVNTTGLAVGLPDGVMGNSEVGHMNIGAGRVVYQDLTRINEAIRDGAFYSNPALTAACKKIVESGGTLHLMGLFSDGGVHSHILHLQALLELCKRQGVARVAIHCFTDGRDTSPTGGAKYLKEFCKRCCTYPQLKIATVMGRYYAMDRDKRWDRTEKAYNAMVLGEGKKAPSAEAAIDSAYAAGETDEFIMPTVIMEKGKPVATIQDHDAVIFYNFRGDRARQITRALTDLSFDGFMRKRWPRLETFVSFTEYDQTFTTPVAFLPQSLKENFGEWVSTHSKTQLRIAETEKYAHVTFFFNGGEERLYPGEERVMIQSPKDVPTYDHKPEMSAREVTDVVVARIENYDAIILNFANADMVGHTGDIPAAVKAVETVDACLGRVVEATLKAGGGLLVTADHGNCEQMQNSDGSPHTSHTTNLVPCIYVTKNIDGIHLRDGGKLADLAPTLLQMMDLPQPKEMTGVSLLSPR